MLYKLSLSFPSREMGIVLALSQLCGCGDSEGETVRVNIVCSTTRGVLIIAVSGGSGATLVSLDSAIGTPSHWTLGQG
jgi:hypothetical protein